MNENNSHPQIQNAELERDKAPALGRAILRETQGAARITVLFIGHRCNPLDPDNFAGGCKDLLDGLRHSGLIPGDEAWRIELQTRQEKVAHRKDERTIIEVEYP